MKLDFPREYLEEKRENIVEDFLLFLKKKKEIEHLSEEEYDKIIASLKTSDIQSLIALIPITSTIDTIVMTPIMIAAFAYFASEQEFSYLISMILAECATRPVRMLYVYILARRYFHIKEPVSYTLLRAIPWNGWVLPMMYCARQDAQFVKQFIGFKKEKVQNILFPLGSIRNDLLMSYAFQSVIRSVV